MVHKFAICLLCIQPNDIHVRFLNSIVGNYTKFILCDSSTANTNFPDTTIQFLTIEDQSCYTSGYRNANFCIPKNPSAWDKVFKYFCEVNTSFDYVWIIEDDVFIPSIHTISYLDNNYGDCDLLSKSNVVNTTGSITNWKMWSQANDKHPLPWYCSMVCACRISKELFSKIKEYVIENNSLFFIEIMINTIAMENGLIVKTPIELSTILPKAPKGNRYRMFSNNRYVWIQHKIEDIQPNYLYHPWKDIELHDQYRLE